jgi:multidrug efflux pump subunit AcrA (membrane-fusion protein)
MKTNTHRFFSARTAIVFAAAVLFSCGAQGEKKAKEEQAPPETVYAVNSYLVEEGNLDAYLEFGGDVAASSSVDILPDAAGKISSILAREGQFVQRDQIIARVDPSRPGLNYETSPIRAPISGTITSLPFSVGATVAPSVSIGKISTANDLEVAIDVAERYVSRIRLNQTALLSFDAYPSERFPARVVEISPVLNTVSRSMTVKLRLAAQDARIKIGMYARVKLITDERKNVIVIPYEAMTRRAGDTYVFAIDRNAEGGIRVTMIDVDEGVRVDDRIEILAGLKAGDEIVIKGQTLLNNNSRVNVVTVVNKEAL